MKLHQKKPAEVASRQKEDDSRPSEPRGNNTPEVQKESYRSLSSAERHSLIHLYQILDRGRSLVLDYYLLRASSARDGREKKAWWILTALLVYVENNHHFPIAEEMNPWIDSFLSKEAKPDIPKLSKVDLIDLKEMIGQLEVLLTSYEKQNRKTRKYSIDPI